jgi:hypothetical protein
LNFPTSILIPTFIPPPPDEIEATDELNETDDADARDDDDDADGHVEASEDAAVDEGQVRIERFLEEIVGSEERFYDHGIEELNVSNVSTSLSDELNSAIPFSVRNLLSPPPHEVVDGDGDGDEDEGEDAILDFGLVSVGISVEEFVECDDDTDH